MKVPLNEHDLFCDSSNPRVVKIDFGIGKIDIHVQPGCSMAINELIQAIKNVAMIVPVHIITKRIGRLKSYVRFLICFPVI